MQNQQAGFDLIRNDKFYELTIPTFVHAEGTVLYQFHLRDLIHNRGYITSFRFSELKQFHEKNLKLKLELPEFPKTHFLKKTNKDNKLIEERRKMLEKYFTVIINDPFARGTTQVKQFIQACKKGIKTLRSLSCQNTTMATDLSRSRSFTKKSSQAQANLIQNYS